MTNTEKIGSIIQTVKGNKDNINTIIDSVEQFFENLQIEIEDWKISMEDFQDGTRIFIRFQIVVKR